MKPYSATIPATNLVLHQENYRLGDLENQAEIINAMIQDQGVKIVHLAEHISENGLNPSESFIVSPIKKSDKFVVLEGNRRLTALKLLANPKLAEDTSINRYLKRLTNASAKYFEGPINSINCIVYNDHNEAFKWIELRHTGMNKGAGLDKWSTDAQDRIRQRNNVQQQATRAKTQEIVLYFKKMKFIKDKEKLPLTNLDRLVSDPTVRKMIGVDFNDNKLVVIDEAKSMPILREIARELVDGTLKVKFIYRRSDRLEYINGILKRLESQKIDPPMELDFHGKAVGEETAKELEEFAPSDLIDMKENNTFNYGGHTESQDGTRFNGTKNKEETKKDSHVISCDQDQKRHAKTRPHTSERKTIIPKSFKLLLTEGKINNIYKELQSIDPDAYICASSILVRVFIELSIDFYISNHELNLNNSNELSKKIYNVIDHMISKGTLEKKYGNSLKGQLSDLSSQNTLTSLHAYVHSKYFQANSNSLKQLWDCISYFVEMLWT